MSAAEGLFDKILRATALFESRDIPFAFGGAADARITRFDAMVAAAR